MMGKSEKSQEKGKKIYTDISIDEMTVTIPRPRPQVTAQMGMFNNPTLWGLSSETMGATKYLFRSVNVSPFTRDAVATKTIGKDEYKVVCLYYTLTIRRSNTELRMRMIAGEGWVPVLDDGDCMTQEEAQATLCAEVSKHLAEFLTSGHNQVDIGKLPSEIQSLFAEGRKLEPAEAMKLLMFFIHLVPPPIWGECILLPALLVVGVAKRGQISSAGISRLHRELGDNPHASGIFTVDNIRRMYRSFGHLIDETNAKDIFETWAKLIPEGLTRIRIYCEQTCWEALTQYHTYLRVLSVHVVDS